MAPARALALVALLCAAASAAGGAPVPKRIPTPEEVALSSAARAYQIALERYNGHAVISGSIQDEEAVRLHAAKEEARRAMIRAEKAAGMKHAPIAPQDGPLVPASPLPERPTEQPLPQVPAAGRGAFLAGGIVIGAALLGVGGYGWWKRRPRTLSCPSCKRKLKVPGRGLKVRCPKCKKVFDA